MTCHVERDPAHEGRYRIARWSPWPRKPVPILDDLDEDEAVARLFAGYHGTDDGGLQEALEKLILARMKNRHIHAPEGVDRVLDRAVRTLERMRKERT